MTQDTLESTDDTNATTNQPDYSAIAVPTKPPEDYTFAERRAELLDIIEQAGHPDAVRPQRELAERYGVDQSTISRDIDRLDEYVRGRLAHRRDLEIGSVLKRCMTGALEEGDYNTARKAAESYDEYLDRRIDTLEFRQRLERLESVAEDGGGPRG